MCSFSLVPIRLRRELAVLECPEDRSVVLDAARSSWVSRSVSTSPQMTNRGSSRGATLSSARSDSRIVGSCGVDTILSSVGNPRYVCNTSNSAVEYRECTVVAARLIGAALVSGNTEETEGDAEDKTGGVAESDGGVKFCGSSSDKEDVRDSRDTRATFGR